MSMLVKNIWSAKTAHNYLMEYIRCTDPSCSENILKKWERRYPGTRPKMEALFKYVDNQYGPIQYIMHSDYCSGKIIEIMIECGFYPFYFARNTVMARTAIFESVKHCGDPEEDSLILLHAGVFFVSTVEAATKIRLEI